MVRESQAGPPKLLSSPAHTPYPTSRAPYPLFRPRLTDVPPLEPTGDVSLTAAVTSARPLPSYTNATAASRNRVLPAAGGQQSPVDPTSASPRAVTADGRGTHQTARARSTAGEC
jgi:hypothetical protein